MCISLANGGASGHFLILGQNTVVFSNTRSAEVWNSQHRYFDHGGKRNIRALPWLPTLGSGRYLDHEIAGVCCRARSALQHEDG